MPDLVEYTFSFQDLLSPEQASNARWVEIMEVIDQLFQEFVYPELQRTKNLKSIGTANDEDLDALNVDKFYQLFDNIQLNAIDKRVGLWMKSEIIKAKNLNESIFLAVSSLGYPRDTVSLFSYYAPKDAEYTPINLRKIGAIGDRSKYFLTSKLGVSLNRNAAFAAGQDPVEAELKIAKQLSENIIPEHIEIKTTYHSTTKGKKISLGYTRETQRINIETV